ncbi:hypothetical protein E0Z10_g2977 [Xylaria hypoxylon]|uniref:Uncharacterized protein n=1 Tax=Xylaria hypoxylon TaxID=37992 RepID=A0A4Z0YPA4_9PEZI|nr:hypothetical protein E0Z10_g2977 [Xylaria hypoxylon]
MDAHPQDPNALPKSRVDSNGAMKPQSSKDSRSDSSLPGKRAPWIEANEKASPLTEAAKGVEGSDSETGTPNELLRSEPQSPLKKRPTSTRASVETSRSLTISDDGSKSKQSRLSVGDSSSIHTTDSNDDRRMSDKVKKAWKEVTGQNNLDPLEQWKYEDPFRTKITLWKLSTLQTLIYHARYDDD